MTENNFNSTFSHLSSNPLPPAPDPRWMADKILRQDRLRTHTLAALAIFFWLLGICGLLLLVFALNDFVLFFRLGGGEAHSAMARIQGTQLIHHCLPWIGGGMLALFLAALFTILLVLTSRQAALNSINITLWQMSNQLKQTRDPDGEEHGSSFIAPAHAARAGALSAKLIRWACIFAALAIVGYFAAWMVLRTPEFGITYPRLSPFQAIRWRGDAPEVEVWNHWYDLVSINGLRVDRIIAESRSMGRSSWQKHFDEDLVELMTRLHNEPGPTVDLNVKQIPSGAAAVLRDVPMTEANRDAIWRAGVQQAPATQSSVP